MKRIFLPIITLLAAAGPMIGSAQTVSSPYSLIGIGDLESSSYSRLSGMANTGLSMRSGKTLLYANPASLSGLDDHFFTFEVAMRGKTVSYAGTAIDATNDKNSDFTFKKVSAGIKIKPWWGSSVGLAPFSSVNYLFNVQKSIEGTGSFYNAAYDGNGGVNQVYWSNGFKILKHLSVGLNAAYLFGSLTQTETITDANSASNIVSTKNVYLHNPLLTYGVQYFNAFNKHWDYALGATFINKTNLSADYSLSVTNNAAAIITDQVLKSDYFVYPASFGVGFSVTKDKHVTYAADYKLQNWSSTGTGQLQSSMVNSNRYSVGVEFSSLKNISNYLIERHYLQFGAFYNDGYLRVNKEQIPEYGLTIGAGFPTKGKINFGGALEFGQRGTTQNGLIKETYTQFTLNISYRDIWFTGGRKYE